MKFFNLLGMSAIAAMMIAAGCRSARQPEPENTLNESVRPEVAPRASFIPRQIIYKTNGDWNNHVAVRLGPDSSLLYYPAPGDISEESAPLVMADGWLMDRQGGISASTAFLKWTYGEYHALDEAPSPRQILESVIPGAKVTEIVTLPMNINEARNDTARVNDFILSM